MLSMRDLVKVKRGEAEQEQQQQLRWFAFPLAPWWWSFRLEFGWCGGDWLVVAG
jgi:hypothetical protein